MRKNLAAVFVVALVGAMAVAFAAPAEKTSKGDGAGPQIGKPAPTFALQDQSGKTVNLSDNTGKIVVLEWFNDECPIDVRVYDDGMNDWAKKWTDQGVVWLAVDSTSTHDAAHMKSAGEKMKIDRPILNDASGKVGHEYAATNTPHMYIIDQSGTLVYKGAIDDNPRGNKAKGEVTNFVDKALSELTAGKPISTPETKAYGCSVKYGK
jgi:peroxiredoxin